MTSRARLAAVQVAVFAGGGLLAPVVHLAGHRDDHTHGPGGRKISFECDVSRDDVASTTRAEHAHGVVAAAQAPHSHDATGHGHARPSSPPPAAERIDASGRAGEATEAQPRKSAHGHGSLAHLGLALLSTAPPLALPAPELAGTVPREPHLSAAALFHPSFPRPRPPPAAALS